VGLVYLLRSSVSTAEIKSEGPQPVFISPCKMGVKTNLRNWVSRFYMNPKPRQRGSTHITQIWTILGAVQIPIAVNANSERVAQSMCKDFYTSSRRDPVDRLVVNYVTVEVRIR
jgi:hypothetical protein